MIQASDTIVICVLISISGMGFIFKATFLIVSFVNRQVTTKLDYRWFLYGLSSVDFFYTLNMFLVQPYITLNAIDPKGTWCFVSEFLVMMTALAGVISQPLLSANHYCSMFYPELYFKKYFKKSYCILMILGVYVLSFLSTYTFVLFDEYGRFEGICCIAVYEMHLWHMFAFFTSPMVISYASCLHCALRISRLIQDRTKIRSNREWSSKTYEAKFIVRFIYSEVFMPILIEIPIFVLTFVHHYLTKVLQVLLGCFVAHGTSDPIVMVLVIKPYRRMIKTWFKKVFRKNRVTPITCVHTADGKTRGKYWF